MARFECSSEEKVGVIPEIRKDTYSRIFIRVQRLKLFSDSAFPEEREEIFSKNVIGRGSLPSKIS